MRADTLRPELKARINVWIISFYHLDPRYKILTFFNLVASEGADHIANDEEDDLYDLDRGSSHHRRGVSSGGSEISDNNLFPATSNASGDEAAPTNKFIGGRPSSAHIPASMVELLARVFDATSILTVWRPCSNDAMRKMMEGTGVGKGLDIKGKSAQQGSLSAFVPFLQIHDEADKRRIQRISSDASMRVYYGSRGARDYVIDVLKTYLADQATNGDSEMDSHEEHNAQMKAKNVLPTRMKTMDKYSHRGWFGLEMSQQLFWNATVVPAKINRKGTGTETGRPSTPGFQDANMKTLKVACASVPKPSPMPVVVQYNTFGHKQQNATQEGSTDGDDMDVTENESGPRWASALDPLYLVMAYEEIGTVTPVVSDFDGFLLGWRREALWFGCNLPRDQEELMLWCIDQIERILDENVEHGSSNTDTWTCRWLDVLKRETVKGLHPEIPEYGFGDPKSYSIMEQAALRLKNTGAVRHGSECFNYYFPQEIDDVFLLISDTLRPVPWRYVNVQELQTILSSKIAEGFVFPLNPKWILCDSGWKKLYDELMESDALYADLSKDVWYPPFSGVRERIESIFKRHPHGFQRQEGRVCRRGSSTQIKNTTGYSPLRQNLNAGEKLSGNAAFDLAELELDDYVRTSVKHTLARQILEANLDDVEEEALEDESERHEFTGIDFEVGYGIGGSTKTVVSHVSDVSTGSASQSVGLTSTQISKRSLFRKLRNEQLMEDSRYREEKTISTATDTGTAAGSRTYEDSVSVSPDRRKMFSKKFRNLVDSISRKS